MDKSKDDFYYISKIIEDMNFIINHTANKTKDDFIKDEVLIDSMMFRLIQISENSNKLTKMFKNNNSDIPWQAIRGLRNRIVHDYGTIDYNKIYDTVVNDIPTTIQIISKVVKF